MSLVNDHWDAWLAEQWLKEQKIDKHLAPTQSALVCHACGSPKLVRKLGLPSSDLLCEECRTINKGVVE